jgi:hypothetical protein
MLVNYDHEKLYEAMSENNDLVSRSLVAVTSNKMRNISMSIVSMLSMDTKALSAMGTASIWSIPKSRRDLLVAIDPRMSSENNYESGKRNYGRYLDDLEKSNIIHSFGFRDLTAYAIEPFALSWSCYNRTTVCLFPASVIRIIDSMDRLFSTFMSISDRRVVSRDTMYERFVHMVSSKVDRLHPSVKKLVPKLDSGNFDDYTDIVKKILMSLPILHGKEYVDFELDKLPSAVYSYGFSNGDEEFAELIPAESRNRVSSVSNAYNSLNSLGERASSVASMPTIDLDVCSDEMHLLQYAEREFHRVNSIPYSKRLFTNYVDERDGARKVMSLLESLGVNTPDTMCSWVSWFAEMNRDPSKFNSVLLELSKTWSMFSSSNHKMHDHYSPEINIVDHLSEIFSTCKIERAVQESFMIYGFAIPYSYMLVTYGKSEAVDNSRAAMTSLDMQANVSVKKVRNKFSMMAEKTVKNGYKIGSILKDMPEFKDAISNLMKKTGVESNFGDKDDPSNSLEKYWIFVESNIHKV